MVSQDFFFYAIGIGFLVLVGFISYAVFNLAQALRELNSILNKVDGIAADAEELKNIVKSGIVYAKNLVFKKGGDKKNGN